MPTIFSQKLNFEFAVLEQDRITKKQLSIAVYFDSSEIHQTVLKVSLHLTDISRKEWDLFYVTAACQCSKNYVVSNLPQTLCITK
jgi:hypothetical protein